MQYSSILIKNYLPIRSVDAVLALKHDDNSDTLQSSNSNELINEDLSTKRRLRSHKHIEGGELILDLGAVAQQSIEVNCSNSADTTQVTQMSSLSLLKQLLPMNMAVSLRTRELLQDILAWQILPSDAPAEPSMIYGPIHLSRLVVKLPDFVNASHMSDDKLKLLLQYLNCFIKYVLSFIFNKVNIFKFIH